MQQVYVFDKYSGLLMQKKCQEYLVDNVLYIIRNTLVAQINR